MQQPVFTVIIPVFNKWELTRDCLKSLHAYTVEYPFEVIVMDNASTDATATELVPLGERLFGNMFTRIRFDENRNFGPACNAGAKKAKASLLFFLNNDTILTKEWAPPLVNALAASPELGAVGPLLLFEDDTIQHLGVTMTLGKCYHLYAGFPATHPVAQKNRDVQMLTAAALMMPKDLFFQCGAFHEGYKNGYEDVDLCCQIARQDKKMRCITSSIIYHLESQTPGRKSSESENSQLVYARCGQYLKTDAHRHALADGFVPSFSDIFDLRITLSEEREQELFSQKTGDHLSEIFATTRQHPYWMKGRQCLVDNLLQNKHYIEALPLISEMAFTLKTIPLFKQLIKISIVTNSKKTLTLAEGWLHAAIFLKSNKNHVLQKFQALIPHFYPEDIPFFEKLLHEKLRTMFP